MEIRNIDTSTLDQVRNLHVYSTGRQWTDNKSSEEELSFYTPNEILGMFDKEKLVSIIRNYIFKQ